jgi:hypothetical protein
MERETDPQLERAIALAVETVEAWTWMLSYLRQFQAQKEIIERYALRIEYLESKLIKVHGALGDEADND